MTTDQAGLCDLPLLVVGLPAAVRECLRAGGVPFVPAGGERQRTARQRGPSPRFLLYDSRDPGSRRDAEGLRLQGLVAIDLAACLARSADSRSRSAAEIPGGGERRVSCSRLLPLLKQSIESAHGLWARMPAVPFPWHYDPTSWNPTPAELLAWRKARGRISVQIIRLPTAYEITASGEFGDFRPALELWRGHHVASFELPPGTTTLPVGGLVYQQDSGRMAEPLPAARTDDSHITSNAGWVKPQSA